MDKLDRNPMSVLDRIQRMAELIECDVSHVHEGSEPLEMALANVRWLMDHAVWLPGERYIQERLAVLTGHLRALASDGAGFTRPERLRMCASELDLLRAPAAVGWFNSPEFDNRR